MNSADISEWNRYIIYYVNDYLFRREINYIDHKELEQYCLINIWNKRAHQKQNQPLKPWLKTCTINYCKNYLRNFFAAKKKIKFVNTEQYEFIGANPYKKSFDFDNFISSLEPTERHIFNRLSSGMTIKQTAALSKLTVPSIYGARNRLRKKYFLVLNS